MAPLPTFQADPLCPKLPAEGPALAIVTSGDGPMGEIVIHGSYRVTDEVRARLGPASIRHQVWLVAIHRGSRVACWGRMAGDALVFGEEEPVRGVVTGYFHVALASTVRMSEKFPGLYDVMAVLGPLRSVPVSVTGRK